MFEENTFILLIQINLRRSDPNNATQRVMKISMVILDMLCKYPTQFGKLFREYDYNYT